MEIRTVLERISQYREKIWCLNPEITYDELARIVEDNYARLNSWGLSRREAIAVDSRLGWKVVGIMLALLRCNIPVFPLDMGKKIDDRLPFKQIISSREVDQSGRLTGLTSRTAASCNDYALQTDIAFLLNTSGSLGNARTVMLTLENILSNAELIAQHYPLTQQDKCLISRPLHHASALIAEVLVSLLVGSSVYIHPPPFSPKHILSAVQKHDLSVLFASPTVLTYVSQFAKQNQIHSVRSIFTSGEKLLPYHVDQISSVFHHARLYNVYGLTEASPRVTLPANVFEHGATCVGKPLPGVRVKLVDDELWVKGKGVMKGYWNNLELTAKKLIHGWLRTGDLFHEDQAGNLYFLGRKDGMIVRGGVNIFPEDIEAILGQLDGIAEVVVFGVADERFGETIHANVVAEHEKVTKASILQQLNMLQVDQNLWPDVIAIKKELSLTLSGKKQRIRGF